MGKYCLYSDEFKDSPCVVLNPFKYSYLKDFFDDNRSNRKLFSVPQKIECIKKGDKKPDIVNERCINCMFCLFGCTGNRVLIENSIHPKEMCVDITSSQLEELKENLLPLLFKGSFIKINSVPYSNIRPKYKTFESFTGVDETTNIAVWGANAMKYLSTSMEPRISLEVGVKIKTRDRGGRLDIALLNLNEKKAFIAETKVSFSKMIDEGRYESQILAYRNELLKECPKDTKFSLFLMIGDKESDLLPPLHPQNTADINKSRLFYDTLKKNKIFFVSANSFLALGLMKMFVSCKKYNLEMLSDIINSEKYLGLLSSGLVTMDEKIVEL